MNRRHFVQTAVAGGVAAGLSGVAGAADDGRRYLVMEWFRSRNDLDVQRIRDFLAKAYVPAHSAAGVKPVGLFQVSIGPAVPSLLAISPYASMAQIQETQAKLARDEKFTGELSSFDDSARLAYARREALLLHTFKTVPGIEVPVKAQGSMARIFELRCYESRNQLDHHKKVAMFDNDEITIFRRCGVNPVFFGSTLFGPNLPNLQYMTCFSSMEARMEAWAKFSQDPDWKRISTAPVNLNIVSNLLIQIMAPLPGSQIE